VVTQLGCSAKFIWIATDFMNEIQWSETKRKVGVAQVEVQRGYCFLNQRWPVRFAST
jgi:hypothetical protein